MKNIFLALLFLALSCNQEKLDQSSLPGIIITQDWLESDNNRSDEFCINDSGEIFFPISYDTTSSRTINSERLGSFSNSFNRYNAIVAKYSKDLVLQKIYEFEAQESEAKIVLYGLLTIRL